MAINGIDFRSGITVVVDKAKVSLGVVEKSRVRDSQTLRTELSAKYGRSVGGDIYYHVTPQGTEYINVGPSEPNWEELDKT